MVGKTGTIYFADEPSLRSLFRFGVTFRFKYSGRKASYETTSRAGSFVAEADALGKNGSWKKLTIKNDTNQIITHKSKQFTSCNADKWLHELRLQLEHFTYDFYLRKLALTLSINIKSDCHLITSLIEIPELFIGLGAVAPKLRIICKNNK